MRPSVKKKLSEAVLPGIVLNLPFNGDTKDYSGFGNDGTNYGATWIGRALSFDGVNNYALVGNSASLQIAGNLTLLVWLKRDSTQLTDYSDFGKGSSYFFRVNTSGTVLFYAQLDSTYYGTPAAGSIGNVWAHLAGTYDKDLATENLKLYINGVKVSTLDQTGDVAISTRPVVLGGEQGNEQTQNYKGFLGEFRAYNRALNPIEIWEEYQRGL